LLQLRLHLGCEELEGAPGLVEGHVTGRELDKAVSRELSTLLRRTREAGVAVVLVEHDVDAVMALADRVAVLDDGRLIALGTPEQVREDPAVIAAYLGTGEEDEEIVRQAAAEVH